EFVSELGADQAIDYRGERFEDRVHDVDMVLDLIGGEVQERSWKTLKQGGTLISTLSRPSQEEARRHDARAQHYMAQPNAAQLGEIGRLIDAGKMTPYVQSIYFLAEAQAAQRELETAHVKGKIVLQVAP